MLQTTVAAVYTATPELPKSVFVIRSPAPWSLAKSAALPALRYSHEQLSEICNLEPNWDGYGGSSIHSDTAANARAALHVFQQNRIVPDMIPNPNGTISFEWSNTRGEAHVEIGKTRFVGLIQPNGTAYIPLAGETRVFDLYDAYLRAIAVAVEALLFPQPNPSLTSTQYAALHVRQAA